MVYKLGLREGYVYIVDDEGDMILIGYLVFLDFFKLFAVLVIKVLLEYGV